MISYLKGKIIYRGKNFIILQTGNIGYKVFIMSTLDLVKEELELFTYLNVREDALTLYGFSTYEELELFEILISVTGVGPKSGLGIMSLSDPSTIKFAIAKGDSSILTRVSGIGKKTAERIILELRNKFTVSETDKLGKKGKEISDHSDALDGLIGLGYSPSQAKKALSQVPADVKDVGERIKMALKELGRK